MMDIDSKMTTQLNYLLNTILSLARSFANANFVPTNFHSFDFLSIHFIVRAYIRDDFLFTEMRTNVYACYFQLL